MNKVKIKTLFKGKYTGNIIILFASIILIYLITSIYFAYHFFFHTEINGVKVSLKAHANTEKTIKSYVKDYKLELIERDGEREVILGQDIGMVFNEKNNMHSVYNRTSSLAWVSSFFKNTKYYVDDLYVYNKDILISKINELKCLNKKIIEPKNVSFKYNNGLYEPMAEVYGNKINKDKLMSVIEASILRGITKIDLNESLCYVDPKYTLSSDKTPIAQDLLNTFVNTRITYLFGSEKEILDASTISEWLGVNDNLDVTINQIAVMKYIRELSKKYDTVGIKRNFKTSIGKVVEVEGGLYGWKINQPGEIKALLNDIKDGKIVEREPVYLQKALSRGKDEIGSTYVEVNITKQHLWFYKKGKLITQGDVVTGNPNRGNSTVVGTYMLNYKQKGANLTGPDYEAEVTYWMPFFGNIGIHDASWRYSFGGKIYKTNGTHGCINAPLYLAKTIFENIEEGTPIICYDEE